MRLARESKWTYVSLANVGALLATCLVTGTPLDVGAVDAETTSDEGASLRLEGAVPTEVYGDGDPFSESLLSSAGLVSIKMREGMRLTDLERSRRVVGLNLQATLAHRPLAVGRVVPALRRRDGGHLRRQGERNNDRREQTTDRCHSEDRSEVRNGPINLLRK